MSQTLTESRSRLWTVITLIFLNMFLLSPFWRSIVWASIITVTVWPLHRWMKSRLKSSFLSAVIVTLLFLLGTLSALIPAMVKIYIEASDFIQKASVEQFQTILAMIPGKLNVLGREIELPLKQIQEFLVSLSSAVLPFLAQLLSSAASSLAQVAITAIIVFFFLKDGDSITDFVNSFFVNRLNCQIFHILDQTAVIVRSVVLACFLTAFVQGVVSGVGWYIFGVSYPLVLAFLVFILGFTPAGPALLYVPVGVALCFLDLFSGVGVLLWHIIFVSLVDNVLRPVLLSRTMSVNEWILMFTTFGAIYYFGFLGLFLAPLLLVFAAQLLDSDASSKSSSDQSV